MEKYLTFLIGLLLFICADAQTKDTENHISNNRITKKQSKLLFDKITLFPNNTQLSIAIIKYGKINFIGVERKNDTIKSIENYKSAFEIGSITKVFTATLLSNFVYNQKLKLDDKIQDYLDFKINSNKDITFKALANHTSGLSRLPSNLSLVEDSNPYKEYDQEKLMDYLKADVNLNQESRTKYEYSNLGAGTLGFVLEIISKSSYESLLQEKIFTKYKMINSTSKRENLKTRLVKGLAPNGKIVSNWDFDVLAGCGAIYSTVEDLSQFALAQFYNTNKELTLTHKPTYKVNNNISIGLGWHILKIENGSELIWHNGGTGGYTSSIALDIENKNGVVILSNVSAFNKLKSNIDQLCIGLIKKID